MSHVLDRMIRRTRSATPAVEPLYQPRYQPRPRAFSGIPAEAEGSFPDVSPESAEFARTTWRTVEAGSGEGAAAYPAARTESNHSAPIFEAGGQILPAVERDAKPADRGRPGSYPASAPREGIEAREIGALDSAEATTREGDRTKSPYAAMQVAARQEPPAIRAPQSARPPRRTAETAAQNPSDAPLDITISIGHIEVRSPQVIERPRRPAFRPKTSLADFLKTRQGGACE